MTRRCKLWNISAPSGVKKLNTQFADLAREPYYLLHFVVRIGLRTLNHHFPGYTLFKSASLGGKWYFREGRARSLDQEFPCQDHDV